MNVPPTMRSWRIDGVGDPRDVARLVEIGTPRPGDGQLLVEVSRVGLNLPDLLIARGQFQRRPPTPYTPGAEFAGTVVAAGQGLEHRIGERVMCAPELDCADGGLAEFVAVDARLAWALPHEVGLADAAALSITYVTALLALQRRGRMTAGETVLVHGGAGGVGVAAIQLALLGGADVIATVGSAEKAEFCAGLGATVVNHREADFVEFVGEHTGGRGVDIVVDPVGGELFDRSRRVIAWEGRHLVIGFAAGIPSVRANSVLLRNYAVIGVNRDEYRYRQPETFAQMHREVIDLCAAGLRPVVGETFPMDRLLDGWDSLEGRNAIGKQLVAPGQRG
ncbi:NADPH:quinone oxidoreductase family protein [Mycolicibacterium sp.]|uniref:NADPH:quinone oxidoreductase family protein n=1 Tax=Mycolicibacterium sp. TaxID=2320850 RepID=UPI003D12C929